MVLLPSPTVLQVECPTELLEQVKLVAPLGPHHGDPAEGGAAESGRGPGAGLRTGAVAMGDSRVVWRRSYMECVNSLVSLIQCKHPR